MSDANASNAVITNRQCSTNLSSGAHGQPTSSPTSWAMRCEELRRWIANRLPTALGCKRKIPTTTKASTEDVSIRTPPSETTPTTVAEPVAPRSIDGPRDAAPQVSTSDAVRDHVTSYVDAWYDENKEGIDIGRIDLPLIGEVDVFPAEREKELYRKVFLLAITNMLQAEIKIAGVPMRLTLSTPETSNEPPEGVS